MGNDPMLYKIKLKTTIHHSLFLVVDLVLPAAISTYCLEFSFMKEYTLTCWVKINPFSLKLLFEYFITTVRKENETNVNTNILNKNVILPFIFSLSKFVVSFMFLAPTALPYIFQIWVRMSQSNNLIEDIINKHNEIIRNNTTYLERWHKHK